MVRTAIRNATRLLAGLRRDCKAATAVEYALILALIVLALMAGLVSLGGQTKVTWDDLRTRITAATGY